MTCSVVKIIVEMNKAAGNSGDVEPLGQAYIVSGVDSQAFPRVCNESSIQKLPEGVIRHVNDNGNHSPGHRPRFARASCVLKLFVRHTLIRVVFLPDACEKMNRIRSR
jgi:hypothetical protein